MSAEPYTAEESNADILLWKDASLEQFRAAFWRLRAVVSADAQRGDEYCARILRETAAMRDGVQP